MQEGIGKFIHAARGQAPPWLESRVLSAPHTAGASARRSIDSEMAGQLITVSKQGSAASSAQLQGTVTEGWVVTARAWATGSQGLCLSPILA